MNTHPKKHSLSGWFSTGLPCLALALLCAACAEAVPAGTSSVPCSSTQDCPQDRQCVQGRCQERQGELDAGTPDADTLLDTSEDEAPCTAASCQERCEPACTAGEVCLEGSCICNDNAQRPCGAKLGECRYGTQLCTRGVWGECEGGVQPTDELCDSKDNDCDGLIDEGAQETFFRDLDNDGWGNADESMEACALDEGFAPRAGDCNDRDQAIHPDAAEACDGIDNDCDVLIDGDDDNLEPSPMVCLQDGVCQGTEPSCAGADGWRCQYPAEAREADEESLCDGLDNDCDGEVDEHLLTTWFQDNDGDGAGADDTARALCDPPGEGFSQEGGDCDDADPQRHPRADEVCDGLDNDCDDLLDHEDPDLQPAPAGTCPPERGVCLGATPSCSGRDGWSCTIPGQDHEPGAETRCDGLDNDCDGLIDEDISQPCGQDVGICTSGLSMCINGRFGPCSGQQGVPDTDDESLLGLCDGLDNDCDGTPDEGCQCRDGQELACGSDVGACTPGVQRCVAGRYGPCDAQGPRAEFCDPDFIDHNCDGLDDIQAGLTTSVYDDLDGDGFGDGDPYHQCGPPRAGQSLQGGDCNDQDRTIHPDATERCDGIDNDCNGLRDDNPEPDDLRCLQEGVCRGTTPSCAGADGWICQYLSARYEQDEATCDGLDNDCDGDTDEGLLTTVYTDLDGDTYGAGAPRQVCGQPPALTSTRAGDCNDRDQTINPDAAEACDGIDNDCDGDIDDGGVCVPPEVTCPSLEDALTEDVVALIGQGHDPDGGAVRMAWRVAQAPPGSTATPTPSDGPEALLVPDEPGDYLLELCATDNEQVTTCCQSAMHVEPRCVTPPSAATASSCAVSWDRRPIIEFAPLPEGVIYHLAIEGQPLTSITATGQNHFRPALPLGPGAAPPEGQSLTITIEPCRAADPTCCAPPEAATFQLIEACDAPIAPTTENLIISEYLVNGDGGACPGDGCEAGEGIEITNLSHCPVSLDGHHFRYCNNVDCTAFRFVDFGPDDIIPPRGVYVTVRNPGASTCALPFLQEDDPGLFGLKRSELVVQSNTTDRSGWFVNSGGGSLRIASGSFIDPTSGQTIAIIDPYRGGQSNCQSVGFDAVDACGEVDAGSEPEVRLLPDQLGRLWHPCDAVVSPVPDTCNNQQ